MRFPAYELLSKEQDKVLSLPFDEKYVISGPPGTGKTVIALHRASTMKKQGIEPTVLMFGRLLSAYTRSNARDLGVATRVMTFHSWVWKFWGRTFSSDIPEVAPFQHDWPAIMMAMVKEQPVREQHLIVDEGQDLHPEFYVTSGMFTEGLTVLADENQRISGTQSTLGEICRNAGITEPIQKLTRNYRNTRQIAALAVEFYNGNLDELPRVPDRDGSMPRILRTESMEGFARIVADFEWEHDDQTIGIFLHTTPMVKAMYRELRTLDTQNEVRYYMSGASDIDPSEPGIIITTYASAKGLEFDTVYIPELQDVALDLEEPTSKMQMYVLVSRARDSLILSYSGDVEPPILEWFPPDRVDGRMNVG